MGYWSNWNGSRDLEKRLVEISENCGYIFQLLNDLEPFSSAQSNYAYKGGRNIDINRNRKNMVAAYIYGAASSKEKNQLSSLKGEALQTLILQLYMKYAVYDNICQNAKLIEQKIDGQIADIQQTNPNIGCVEDFKTFVHDVIGLCFSRLR